MSTDNYLFDKFVLRIILFVYSIESAILKRCALLITKALKILKKKRFVTKRSQMSHDCLQSMIENSKKEEKKETLFFFSQANRLFDKLVIRHRLPLRSIFFFDFHLKTTSGVHDSSLSPPPLLLLLPPSSSSFLFSPNAFELRRLESGDLFKNIRTRVLDLGQPGHPRTALERNTRVSVHFFFFFQGAAKKLESHDRFREI